jgi:hypothetical protein
MSDYSILVCSFVVVNKSSCSSYIVFDKCLLEWKPLTLWVCSRTQQKHNQGMFCCCFFLLLVDGNCLVLVCRWGKTKFGGFTYLKKHPHQKAAVSYRSAGSTSAGKRPKTAPASARDKWKTQKVSTDIKTIMSVCFCSKFVAKIIVCSVHNFQQEKSASGCKLSCDLLQCTDFFF